MERKPKLDKVLTGMGLAAAATVLLMTSRAGLAAGEVVNNDPGGTTGIGIGGDLVIGEGANGGDQQQALPSMITLTGTVRDFRERHTEGGHIDFEKKPDNGYAHYMGNIDENLDDEGKPVFTGGGYRVGNQWTDSSGRAIFPGLYDPERGDQSGSISKNDCPGGIHSAEEFAQWYRDVPGVNLSAPLDIVLNLDEDSGQYVFDDREDDQYSSGFFPINGQLYGNSAGDNKNFHFTFELDTEFTFEADSGQVFTFRGDDDVWVFVDGRMVIDIGGVHSAKEQTVELDRLDWLVDGQTYSLNFFFAERHRTASNFRIETTLNLRNGKLPTSSGLYD